MNEQQLKSQFPNASAEFIRLNSADAVANGNAGGTAVQPRNRRKAAKLERNLGDGTLGAGQVQIPVTGRFLVRITAVRSRLLDEDNMCEKYVVDCCRYAGVLPGDSPATTKIETRQEKAEPGGREFVRVEIFKR